MFELISDEYIASHGIKNPYSKCNKCKPSTITSKFERFVDDVGDDETSEMDVEGKFGLLLK